jgi:sensor histidine kinase regulating citrate/malate metabolism
MDYVTIPGISTRTGVEEIELAIFIVKELVDNALDFVEKNTAGKKNNKKDDELAPVQVFVLRESKYLKIRVLNLNFGISVFTENIINSIFDFGAFTAAKETTIK